MVEAGKVHSPPLGRQKERPDQSFNVIGTRMLRKVVPRFLVGCGRFVDDIAVPTMAHAAVLRSPHARSLCDSGNYPAALDLALKMLDYDGWREKQQIAGTQGRYVGIGIASCQEKGVFSATEFWMLNRAPGFALTSSPESASVKIDATGKAVISLHAPFWGNSPETVAAMVLAEQLTMEPADIRVTYSDTDHGPGTAPGGSRYKSW
jgi:CO/xanthine dehydrogenase Mo-binding subunit